MKKRILVLILVIALFMTCVPVAVSAAAEPTLTLSPDTSRTIVAGQTGKVVFTIQTLYTNERYNVIIYNAGGNEVAKVSSPYQNLSSGNIYRSVNINTQNLGMGVGTYTVKCYLEYYAQGEYQRASETHSYSLQVVADTCDDEHTFIYDGIYRETTCKTAGLAEYVCSDCGYRKFVSIPMDHNYDSGVCTLPATADSEGIVTYTCRTCGSTKEESFSKAAPTVTLKGLTATGKNKLTWNALEGADRYYVYYATAQEGPYALLKDMTGTSLTHSSGTAGTTYYYCVIAVYDNLYFASSYPSGRTCDLPRPVVKADNIASTGKVRITWDAIEGADRYKLYIYDEAGSLLKSVSTTGTVINHNSAVTGETYTYKVRAYMDGVSDATSAYSKSVDRTCDLAQPVLTVSNNASTGKVKVSWKAVDGATKYTLYIYNSDGTLLKTTSTSGTVVNHNSAVTGETYTYKVRALCSVANAASAYSATKDRTCDLPRPVVTVSLNSKGKPVVDWADIDGAVKYTIYIYNADGSLLKTVSATGSKLTHTSAVAGTTYKYRVVAVHSVTSANSAKSTTMSVTSE